MRLSVGTSGYSYKEWKGSFYPDDLAAKDMLRFYARKLGAVEINNTFYRMPKSSVLEGWCEQVPESFRFSVKASRRITHFKRLKETGEETGYLLKTVAGMGRRLGVVLFQLPPNFKKDLPRLEEFLKIIPATMRATFEFRHASWHDDEVHACLREHDRALCVADTDESDADLVSTAGWGYLRLRKAEYDDDALRSWAGRIAETGWDEAFVFFKHEDEGAGPRLAGRFLEIAG